MNIKSYYQLTMAALLLTAAGCSNDDIQTANSTNTDKETVETAQTHFVTEEESTTRTSLNYKTSDFYWEDGDRIYVKDDGNAFQLSSNAVTGTLPANPTDSTSSSSIMPPPISVSSPRTAIRLQAPMSRRLK